MNNIKLSMNRFISSSLILILILMMAGILRLWNLNNIPPSLTPDEAALGYNAYSILKTGKDEYGKFMPVIFKSFGDYKPGLYVYATVPFVSAMGLSEWSVRLPSALAGVLSVYLIYLIVKYFSGKQTLLPFAAAIISATNPWLIYMSRGAWEANLSLMLTLAGIFFFLKSLKEPGKLILSSIFFALTLLTYQGAKLSTTIVLLIMLIVYARDIFKLVRGNFVTLAKSAVVGLIIISPVILSFFNGQTGRLDVASVFSYPRPLEYTQKFLSEDSETIGDAKYYLYHTENYNFLRGIAGRWFNHFSGKFLFFEGDYQNPMHSAPNSGMLLLTDIVFILLGCIYLIRSNILSNQFKTFLILWLFLSPLPAVLSRDQVQSVRAINMAVPLVLLTSLGLYYLAKLIAKMKFNFLRFPMILFVLMAYGLSLIYFIDSYFIHMPIHNAKYWSYGYKQVVSEIIPIQKNYDKILFQQSYDQPYIYFLFYGSQLDPKSFDPRKYQSNSHLDLSGVDVGLVRQIDNIYFADFSWPPPIDPKQKTLVAGNPVAIPADYSKTDYNLIKEIRLPDNFTTAFRILEKR